jgi:hypothetical protein
VSHGPGVDREQLDRRPLDTVRSRSLVQQNTLEPQTVRRETAQTAHTTEQRAALGRARPEVRPTSNGCTWPQTDVKHT